MVLLMSWAQHIVTLRGDAASFITDASPVFKLHLFLGMSLLSIFRHPPGACGAALPPWLPGPRLATRAPHAAERGGPPCVCLEQTFPSAARPSGRHAQATFSRCSLSIAGAFSWPRAFFGPDTWQARTATLGPARHTLHCADGTSPRQRLSVLLFHTPNWCRSCWKTLAGPNCSTTPPCGWKAATRVTRR